MTFSLLLLGAFQQAVLPPTDDGGWKSLDRVVLAINEDTVTLFELARGISLERRQRPLNSEAELRRVEQEILDRSAREKLAAQAGEDLGYDPNAIAAQVRDRLERVVERHNGVAGMAKYLESRELTTRETREVLEANLYAELWEATLTGEGAGPGRRPEYDRYVRPGRIEFEYRNSLGDSRFVEELGGQPPRVVLQTLFLASDEVRGPEATAKFAEELREKVVAGADLSEVIVEHSIAPRDRGMSDPIDERSLARFDPRMSEFVQRGKAGDISPVEEILREGRTYWRVVKIVERQPEVVPEFGSYAVQKKIVERTLKSVDDRRLGLGYRVMFDASYIWPPEYKR